mgnify:CR=1 FL=1
MQLRNTSFRLNQGVKPNKFGHAVRQALVSDTATRKLTPIDASLSSDADFLFTAFAAHEKQARHLMEQQLALPAYEQVLKAAHSFNLLDARGAISVTERAAYIGRIRNLARAVAQSYYDSRERLGFPMAPAEWVAEMSKKAA